MNLNPEYVPPGLADQARNETPQITTNPLNAFGDLEVPLTVIDPAQLPPAQGLDPKFIAELEKQFGFDKPAYERFLIMLKNYLTFDFGKSYFRDTTVIQLIKEKLPVSMSLGIWMMLISYLVAIPLGIRKAVQDGSRFDMWTSTIIIIGYALPGFLVAILLIILFAGGSYFDWFPLRGLTSDNWATLSWWQKILDYFWHLVLPISAMMLRGPPEM